MAQNSHGWPTRSCQKIRPEQTPLKLPSSLVRSPQFEILIFVLICYTHIVNLSTVNPEGDDCAGFYPTPYIHILYSLLGLYAATEQLSLVNE